MKRILIVLLPLLLLACTNHKQTNTAVLVKHSMEVAESEITQGNGNPKLAKFLLEEIEDDMQEAPDSIRKGYQLLRVRAESAQDSTSNAAIIHDFTQLVNNWRLSQNELEEQNHRNMMLITGSTILLILLICVSVCLHQRNKNERQKRETMSEELARATSHPRDSFPQIVNELQQKANCAQKATKEDLDHLKEHIYQETPLFIEHLEQVHNLTRQEWSILLLSWTDLHQKEVATLCGISQQNLRNIRLRTYAHLTNTPCQTIKQFSQFIEDLKHE